MSEKIINTVKNKVNKTYSYIQEGVAEVNLFTLYIFIFIVVFLLYEYYVDQKLQIMRDKVRTLLNKNQENTNNYWNDEEDGLKEGDFKNKNAYQKAIIEKKRKKYEIEKKRKQYIVNIVNEYYEKERKTPDKYLEKFKNGLISGSLIGFLSNGGSIKKMIAGGILFGSVGPILLYLS